jgi:hypothetical protein
MVHSNSGGVISGGRNVPLNLSFSSTGTAGTEDGMFVQRTEQETEILRVSTTRSARVVCSVMKCCGAGDVMIYIDLTILCEWSVGAETRASGPCRCEC